ncbi:MAG: hypothetical protein AB2814_07050, partial [Candidatus Sedimenticola endophacoides]
MSAPSFDTFGWRLYKGGELLRLELEGRERHLIWSGLDDANPRQSLRNPERLPVFAPDLPPGAMAERLGPLMAMRALLPVVEVKSRMVILTINLRSCKIPITWHRVTRHFQNIEYRPGIEQ